MISVLCTWNIRKLLKFKHKFVKDYNPGQLLNDLEKSMTHDCFTGTGFIVNNVRRYSIMNNYALLKDKTIISRFPCGTVHENT